MVSKNELLNGVKLNEEPALHPSMQPQKYTPCWMYSKECPEGRVVKWDKELLELIEAGWVDHPGKVRRLPGHEKFFGKEAEAGGSKIDLSEKDTKKKGK